MKQFTEEQFKAYADFKRPSEIVWYATMFAIILIASTSIAVIVQYAESIHLEYGSNFTYISLVFFAMILVIGMISGLGVYWFKTLRNFTSKKELLLTKTFDQFGWHEGVYPAISDYPIVPSSIIHDLHDRDSIQAPIYKKFEGWLEDLPLECVFLDSRPFITSPNAAIMYIHIALPSSYPHTIVDGKDGFMQHDLEATIQDVERVSLESTLSQYFDVYTIKNSGQSALYTLTPDILSHLQDYSTAFNIEVIGNSLYILSNPSNLEDAKRFADFMNLAKFLAMQFMKRARARGIQKGQYKYNSNYAQTRMNIKTKFIVFNQEKS